MRCWCTVAVSVAPLSSSAPREATTCRLAVRLTQLVLSGVVGNLHDVELQALVALPDAVDASDVGTRLVHGPHQLRFRAKRGQSEFFKIGFIQLKFTFLHV